MVRGTDEIVLLVLRLAGTRPLLTEQQQEDSCPRNAGAERPRRFCLGPSLHRKGTHQVIVVMRTGASAEQIDEIKRTIEEHGLEAYVSRGEERTVIGVVGQGVERVEHIKQMPGVEQVIRVSKPYKLTSREHHPDRTRVRVGNIDVGAGNPLRMMAGPCAVESQEQLLATARWVKREGAVALRG